MARIFTDGAETGDLSFWSVYGTGSSTDSTTPGNGTYAYKGLGINGTFQKNFTGVSEAFFRARLYCKTNSTSYANTIQFRNGTTSLLTLTYDRPTRRWNITVATTGSTGTDSFFEDQYYLMEIYYKISNTVGVITIKIDGVQVFTFSGDTQPAALTTIDNLYFAGTGSSLTSILLIDDLAMNDTTGGADNSWCGNGKVIALVPNGNGDSSQWVGSDGNSTDNYLLINELPPSNTQYVTTSGSGNIDNYALETYTLISGENILRVWTTAIARETTTSGTLNLGLKTLSTDYSTTVSIPTSFTRVNGSGYTLNPNTGAAWTQAQLDALQATIEMP